MTKTEEIAQAIQEWRDHGTTGDTRLDVSKAIAQLPAPNRKIVMLRVFEELTWLECAEAMSYGRPKKVTPDQARAMFRTSALALKKILTRHPKVAPLVRARLDKVKKI